MKKLTDDLRNRIYKLCGSHIMTELERTIREFNMNTEAANQAANRMEKGRVSNMPKDLFFIIQLQGHAWAAIAQVYNENLLKLIRDVKISDEAFSQELMAHIYGDIEAPKEAKE